MSPLHPATRFLGREAVRSSRGTGLFALAVIILIALGVASELPQARTARTTATAALTPAMQAATWVDGTLNGAATWLAGNRRAAEQDQQLQAENRRLAAEVAQLQATQRQNGQLRAELGLRRQDHLLTTGATVVARDPDGLGRTITIDHGTTSGVRPGMAVISGAGLVGVVRAVTAWSAQVETTAQPALAVPVLTAGTGLTGTAHGSPQALPVRLLTTGQTQPQPGEAVVTAGGGAIPTGLPLGRLTSVSIDGEPGIATGLVTPFSDPAQAAQVLVVRAVQG